MAGNVLDDSVDLSHTKFVEVSEGERFRRKCNPESGDLLVVSRGVTIGRLCVVHRTDTFCLMGSVILIKPLRGIVDVEFLVSFLKHPVMHSALYRTSGSSAQQAIYLKDLKNLDCFVPPLESQQRFAKHVAAIRRNQRLHQGHFDQLDSLFTALQHSAFRGEL